MTHNLLFIVNHAWNRSSHFYVYHTILFASFQNWGLVTYREVDLLIDPTKASNSQKQRVCTVVTHELAHQWFGNLGKSSQPSKFQ